MTGTFTWDRSLAARTRAHGSSMVVTKTPPFLLQREPFESKGARAETFADGTRFAKERLWHVDVLFAEPIEGPLILGDGRFLGLGVMAPAARSDLATASASLGLHVFAVDDGLAENADAATIARALRRAVMARVQERLGSGKRLPAFFSGHAADGSPAHSDESPHLAFVHDPPRRRVLVVAPHAIEGRRPIGNERNDRRILDDALREFRTLRAGPAGVLNLRRTFIDRLTDPLFAPSKTWRGVTPYVVNRHIRAGTAQEALAQDLEAECRRRSLPDARNHRERLPWRRGHRAAGPRNFAVQGGSSRHPLC